MHTRGAVKAKTHMAVELASSRPREQVGGRQIVSAGRKMVRRGRKRARTVYRILPRYMYNPAVNGSDSISPWCGGDDYPQVLVVRDFLLQLRLRSPLHAIWDI
jgi:hypothetical protein